MVLRLVKNVPAWLVAVVVVIVTQQAISMCEAKQCGVICRVRDPSAIGNSVMLKECLYEVYPVESTQNPAGTGLNLYANDDSRNRLFSLYGGQSSCEYFGNMIQTPKGRDTLVETILRQLQKSGFKGLDLQCDPVQARVTQQVYAEFMEQLRSFLGNTYVIMVSMSSCQLEPRLVESLNRAVDFVTINPVGQPSLLTNALMFGLARHRVLLTTPYPSTIQCPLNTNDYSLNEVLNQIESHNLFGAVVQMDRDDVNNVCGNGAFPMFRKVLERLCPDAECNFHGFVRDTRDCGQYYSCDNGYKKTHHCPTGCSFDLCKSTCEPFMQVHCNSTTCLVSGGLPQGLVPIPFPIPFPMVNTNCSLLCGGGNNGGGGGGGNNNTGGHTGGNQTAECCCEVLKNLTLILTGTDQFSELIAFVKELGVDDTFKEIRLALSGLTPLLNKIVTAVNQLLGQLLNGHGLMNNTMSGMQNMNSHTNLINEILNIVLNLVRNLLGSLTGGGGGGGDPITGLLGSLLGGGHTGGDTGHTGGLTATGTGTVGAVVGGGAVPVAGGLPVLGGLTGTGAGMLSAGL